MSDTEKSLSIEDHLEDLFAAARSAPPQLPAALQSAMLADAQHIQQERASALAAADVVKISARQGLVLRLWQQFTAAVGGWPALGGMAVASLSGLWIGLAPPSFLPDPVESLASYSSGTQLLSDLGYDVSYLMSDEVFE